MGKGAGEGQRVSKKLGGGVHTLMEQTEAGELGSPVGAQALFISESPTGYVLGVEKDALGTSAKEWLI